LEDVKVSVEVALSVVVDVGVSAAELDAEEVAVADGVR
jgi:hypothetical protein